MERDEDRDIALSVPPGYFQTFEHKVKPPQGQVQGYKSEVQTCRVYRVQGLRVFVIGFKGLRL